MTCSSIDLHLCFVDDLDGKGVCQRILRDQIDLALKELLEFLGITRIAYEQGRNLSYGQKKLMDFAALLMSDPEIILLDEPASGVNPRLLDDIIAHIRALNERGLTILIVEHNMDLVMKLCDHVVVLAQGKVIAQGKPAVVQADPEVLEAYLGGAVVDLGAGEAGHA